MSGPAGMVESSDREQEFDVRFPPIGAKAPMAQVYYYVYDHYLHYDSNKTTG